jgi:hypothetical protein
MKRFILLLAIMLYLILPAESQIDDNTDKDKSTSEINNQTTNTPINELSWIAILADARPNPARGSTWIGYTLPEKSQNVKLVVRNLLGSVVYDEIIDIDNHGFRLDVSNFNNGIYIYTLMISNNPVKSKRLVVAN